MVWKRFKLNILVSLWSENALQTQITAVLPITFKRFNDGMYSDVYGYIFFELAMIVTVSGLSIFTSVLITSAIGVREMEHFCVHFSVSLIQCGMLLGTVVMNLLLM